MSLHQIILFNLLLLLVVLTIVLVGVLFSYANLLKRLQARESEASKLKGEMQNRASYLIEEAHKKALKILGEANLKAQEMLNQAQFVDEASKAAFRAKLEELGKEQENELKAITFELARTHEELMSEIKETGSIAISDVVKTMQEEARAEIDQFKNVLEKETVEKEQQVSQHMQEAYDLVEKEIAEYKLSQMKKIEAQIQGILLDASKQVIGKALTYQDQEDLIVKTLEEAKKKGDLG